MDDRCCAICGTNVELVYAFGKSDVVCDECWEAWREYNRSMLVRFRREYRATHPMFIHKLTYIAHNQSDNVVAIIIYGKKLSKKEAWETAVEQLLFESQNKELQQEVENHYFEDHLELCITERTE